MQITDETNVALSEVFAVADEIPKNEDEKNWKGNSRDRFVIRFRPETQEIWRGDAKVLQSTNRIKGAVVTHIVFNDGARTPTGGRFHSTRFTVSYKGRKWVGQTKNGTDVVRLRPKPEVFTPGDNDRIHSDFQTEG